jgi:orotate phosphoribosyltransferase
VAGPVQPGERVVVLVDVVTTGGSALLAVDAAHLGEKAAELPAPGWTPWLEMVY